MPAENENRIVGTSFVGNSRGSRSGVNEFGKKVQTGDYDMDYLYLEDVLKSGKHFLIFTFPK
jgi:hypothetical protein